MKITVSKQFQDLIYPLSNDEFLGLEKSIIEFGVKDPLVVWALSGKKILIDGHHRWKCIRKHKIAKYKVVQMKFQNKHEAISYVLDLQLARRNCTPEGISYLRGLRYRNEKLAPHRPKKGDKMSSLKTSEKIAQQYKITARTIFRDEKFTDAVDAIIKKIPSHRQKDIKSRLLTRELNLNKNEIVELSELPKRSVLDVVEKGKHFRGGQNMKITVSKQFHNLIFIEI